MNEAQSYGSSLDEFSLEELLRLSTLASTRRKIVHLVTPEGQRKVEVAKPNEAYL